MKHLWHLAVCSAVLTSIVSCVSTVQMVSTFDPSEVEYIREQGTNTIEGNAFIRQRGGGTVTCAGEDVWLVPAGEYARERMRITFGTDVRSAYMAFAANVFGGQVPSNTGSGGYWEYQRNAKCDSEGRFQFEDVAVGSYFLVTQVVWTVGNSFVPEGGLLMAPVRFVDTDRIENIVLSP